MSFVTDKCWSCPEPQCGRTVHFRTDNELRAEQKRHWKAHRASDRIVLALNSDKKEQG